MRRGWGRTLTPLRGKKGSGDEPNRGKLGGTA